MNKKIIRLYEPYRVQTILRTVSLGSPSFCPHPQVYLTVMDLALINAKS